MTTSFMHFPYQSLGLLVRFELQNMARPRGSHCRACQSPAAQEGITRATRSAGSGRLPGRVFPPLRPWTVLRGTWASKCPGAETVGQIDDAFAAIPGNGYCGVLFGP